MGQSHMGSRVVCDDPIQEVAVVGRRNVILDTVPEGISVYFFMPESYGHKLEVGDDLHQPSFLQFLCYIHALYIGKLQVLDQVGR